jgi:hypothetical protein
MQKKILGITLFEEQLLRIYLLSDNYALLHKLQAEYQIIIFSSPDLAEKIAQHITKQELDPLKIIQFTNVKESILIKLFSFIFNWLDPSTGTLRRLYKEKSLGRVSLIGAVVRQCLYTFFAKFGLLKKPLRYLFYSCVRKSFIVKSFLGIPPNLDILFATSLTNTESDLMVAIYYKKYNIPVVATVRSWDNLLTKGVLRFAPDVFVSHSNLMSNTAIENHKIAEISICTLVTPCYQKKFKPIQGQKIKKYNNLAYGCIGPFLNPDEINFIHELSMMSLKTQYTMTLIQHPKFPHDLTNIKLNKLQVKCFDYNESSLTDYYAFLSEQNFIIASGTTVALDCLFVGTPLLALHFEIENQKFWESHLRSYDFLPHTKALFDLNFIPRVSSSTELLEYISGEKILPDKYPSFMDLTEITGDMNKDLNHELLNIINEFLR